MRTLRNLWIAPALVVAALGYMAFDDGAGLGTWLGDRQGLEAAEQRIADLEAEIRRLERDAELLHDDPFAIERAIREELRFARADETVVRLPAATSRSTPHAGTNPRFP